MEYVGIGLIGTGFMGKCHALAWNAVRPVFQDGPQIRLVHMAEIDMDLAREKAAVFGFEKYTDDWRRLIDDPEVDVVSVTTPSVFHAEMAQAALEAGKHVWCEKPMAPAIADALAMRAAARKAGRTAILGYNYIQNPMIRQMGRFLAEGAIGEVNHVRIEMDEDFMADADAPFSWRSEAASGYGALDDFAVHPLSLLWTLFGRLRSVTTDMAKPYAKRPDGSGSRPVENHDVASVLFRLETGASGVLMANRAAWGRKGRIAIQLYGTAGSMTYDQERMNELRVYRAREAPAAAGFSTVLAGPAHEPYAKFQPAPGHGLGFNDLKVIECRELLAAMAGRPARVVDFERGSEIEQAVHAMAAAHEGRGWVDVEYA